MVNKVFKTLREQVHAFPRETLASLDRLGSGVRIQFLGIKVVTRLRGNPISAFAFSIKENRRSDQTFENVYITKRQKKTLLKWETVIQKS